MKIERDKIYVDRDGEEWRIICVDAQYCPGSVIGLSESLKSSTIRWFNRDGSFGPDLDDGDVCGWDLIAEKPREWCVSDYGSAGITTPGSESDRLRGRAHKIITVREVL